MLVDCNISFFIIFKVHSSSMDSVFCMKGISYQKCVCMYRYTVNHEAEHKYNTNVSLTYILCDFIVKYSLFGSTFSILRHSFSVEIHMLR